MADSSGGSHPRVGLVYDEKMCAHATPDGEDHPECPERLRAIWNKLHTAGVLDRCVILNAKKTNDIYVAINLVHSKKHVELIQRVSDKAFNSKRQRIANKFNSIYLNKGSSEAAYLAAGSVLEAVKRVASGEFNSAFAVVRPPGHHAEEGEPMGFCLYNNVALATSYILNNRPDLGIAKILIVDWDVHHGNGTQKMFWKDSRVLFFSVHRHDNGTFYPGNDDGKYDMIGEGTGIGYNINVPWEDGGCGDADYLAVWDNVLIPVAKEFNPDLVIVSAGFDAAIHDPLGGCRVTPYGYSMLLRKLMDFADGKIVLALEGGYNLQSLANSVLACVQVLLDGKPISGSVEECAFKSTWRTIEAVRQVFKGYWPSLGKELVKNMETQTTSADQFSDLSSDSGSEKLEEVFEDAIQPLSDLSMNNLDMVKSSFITKPRGGASASTGIPHKASGAGPSNIAPSPTRSVSKDPMKTAGPVILSDTTVRDVALIEASQAKHNKRQPDQPAEGSNKRAKKTAGARAPIPQTHPVHNGPYTFTKETSLPESLVRRTANVPQQLIEAFAIRHPAAAKIKHQIERDTYCPGERAWFDQLPADALFMQLTRYLEMVRCGANAAWLYTAQLEEKTRRQEEGEFITGEVERLVASLWDAILENSKLIASRDEIIASKDEMAARIAKLEEDIKTKEMDKRVAESQLKTTKETCVGLTKENKAMKQACDDWTRKEEAWLKEKSTLEARCSFTEAKKEAFKDTYYNSEECQRRLGEEIYPHWQHGVRVGIRQAVARFKQNPNDIASFEPNYDDHCGEPEIGGSDDENTLDAAS